MFIVKIHKTSDSKIIAIIDKNLLGKIIVEKNKILNLKSNFYKGERKNKDEIISLIKPFVQLNVVGNEIVNFLKKEKILENYLEINGIKYAQVIFI